jgi:hypothetical protein
MNNLMNIRMAAGAEAVLSIRPDPAAPLVNRLETDAGGRGLRQRPGRRGQMALID